jgi:hypothetical protein
MINCQKNLTNNILKKVPLRYLFGVLFENFKLVWEPVTTLIQSYASQLKMQVFWLIFGDYFASLSDVIGRLN